MIAMLSFIKVIFLYLRFQKPTKVSKKIISLFFSAVFLAFLAMPAIIVMVDGSVDISYFYSVSEEEEKGNEKKLDIKILYSTLKTNSLGLVFTYQNSGFRCFLSKYTKPNLNIISPPPDSYIL